MNLIKIGFLFAHLALAMDLKDPVCGQQPAKNGDRGRVCRAYIPRFTFNSEKNECSKFIYGGCGGNQNRFTTNTKCEAMCKQ